MSFNLGSEGNVYLTGMEGQEQEACGFDYQLDPDYSYPQGCSLQSPTQSPSGWSFPLQAPYMESPLSSAGALDPSWNPFDHSFASSEHSSEKCYPPQTYSNFPTGTLPFVNLASIDERDALDEDAIGEDADYYRDEHRHHGRGSKSGRSKSTSSIPKAAVLNSRRRNSHEESRSHHSRNKSESSTRLRSTQVSHLRQATLHSSSSSSSGSTSEGKWKRTNHNQVEKQYRNRLNDQFETLLRALPRDGDKEGEKRVSKADVLVLAKRYIMEMEREGTLREGESEKLEENVEDLKRRWVGLGGVCMP